ncbi:MAG TPA: tetratricopeptide repeat protein, partial [Bacteroidales bacterium]|nr:tetratricopeptide repeat protein [Bacteroidales bacterium]
KGSNRVDNAISQYKALIGQRPDIASPHDLLGTLYEKQGKYDLAESHYKKALDIDSAFIPAMNNLAYLYAQLDKELNKALDLARGAKKKMLNNPAIADTLGWVYYKKELYDSAIGEFESCVEQEPHNPIFHYHLGLAYNKKWKHKQAEIEFKKALEIQSDFKGADDARQKLNTGTQY